MKSGFVAIVGRSNVGKSTLLNTLVGTKIAATSFRAQMTRHNIHGVLNMPEGQAVFIDTPGMLKGDKSILTKKLLHKIEEALSEIDVIVYVVDPSREIGEEEKAMIALVRHIEKPKILVINKSDLENEDRKFEEDYDFMSKDFDATFKISALRGSHITPLKEKVMEYLPEGEQMYPDDQLTNVDNYFWIAEIIREKAFSILNKEIPYSVNVEVEEVKEKDDLISITAKILTDAERYKKMIIGKNASVIKEIGQLARKELEQATNKKVYLDLQVAVDIHWVERI
ncbi:MAG: GTPase Era [Candidatus Magasanikbacteria bacterium]